MQASSNSDPATPISNSSQADELETFLDAQDLILDESQMNPDNYGNHSSSCSSSASSSSSSNSSHAASSPQSSLNFNSNSSEVEEEIKTPTMDFMDPIHDFHSSINNEDRHRQEGNRLSFDFDFTTHPASSSSYTHASPSKNFDQPSQIKSFNPSQSGQIGNVNQQQPDWSDASTLTNLWPSLFNEAINSQNHISTISNPMALANQNHDQWIFNAQLPISTIDPSTVASSSSSSSFSSTSSSGSDNDNGAIPSTSNPTYTCASTHNSPSPPQPIKSEVQESSGPAEKKRKVSSSSSAGASASTNSTSNPPPPAPPSTKSTSTKKGVNTRTNNKRKQNNVNVTPDSKEENQEQTPPPVSTKPLPQVDTSVSHSSLFVHPDVSGLSKRDARLVKNRAAAFLSRQRKREEFGELEKKSKALEGAVRAIWKSLVKLRQEANSVEGKQRVDDLIRIYLDLEEKSKLKQEEEQGDKEENLVKSIGVREVLNEVVGGITLDDNQVNIGDEKKEPTQHEKRGNNKKGNKRSRDSASSESSPSASTTSSSSSSGTSTPQSMVSSSTSLNTTVSVELEALRSELNTSKIQNTALLQQLAIERSQNSIKNSNMLPLPLSVPSNGHENITSSVDSRIKSEDSDGESLSEPQAEGLLQGMDLDFDYNFSDSFLSNHHQNGNLSQVLEPEFSYPPPPTPTIANPNPNLSQEEGHLSSNENPTITNSNSIPSSASTSLSMKKRSHNLSLAPAFSPSNVGIGNGPSSPFSLSIPPSPLLRSNSDSHSASITNSHPDQQGNGNDQKSRKTAGGMALMVILFSFALWGMPAGSGSGREGGMARLNGQSASSGEFDLGRVLNPSLTPRSNQFNKNPSSRSSKSKKSTPSSHLSPKDLHLEEDEDSSSFSLLIPKKTDSNASTEQRLPSCSITEVSKETARLLPVCRIEPESGFGNGSETEEKIVTPILSRTDSNSENERKINRLNSSIENKDQDATQSEDENGNERKPKPSSNLALAYLTDSSNLLLDSTSSRKSNEENLQGRIGTDSYSWLNQVLPLNLDINLSDLRSELLDFSGWLSAGGAMGSKDRDSSSPSSPSFSPSPSSVYRDSGSDSDAHQSEKNPAMDLAREEFGNYLESRLDLNMRERGFVLVGPPASSEISRRSGGNGKKSKTRIESIISNDGFVEASEEMSQEEHQDEDRDCPSIPTKLTLFLPTPKNFKPQEECPVSKMKPSSRFSTSSSPSSSSSSSSGGLSGLATKALSLRPDSSITMSRDLGDGLNIPPKPKSKSKAKEENQFSSSTEAVLRALGLSQCPTLDQLKQQQEEEEGFGRVQLGPSSVDSDSNLNLEEDSFLELQFSLKTAKIKNKNQLADAVVGAIQRS